MLRSARVLAALAMLLPLASFAHLPPFVLLSAFCNGNDALDDTACIAQWLNAGTLAGTVHVGTSGTFYYAQSSTLNSNLHIRCADDYQTRFRRFAGGAGPFLKAASSVRNVRIEKCLFDVDGSTETYLSVIEINPGTTTHSRNIQVVGNRFRDGAIAGHMSAAQRQYVLLLKCDTCRVIGNVLTEGGRIKVGAPGTVLEIRNNVLADVNDNAITVVDANQGGLSDSITIAGNHIWNPKGNGIFFGADGEAQTDPALTTSRVVIDGNQIAGDWASTCILGTLPAHASQIRITNNTCTKTGPSAPYATGITLRRTNSAPAPSQDIVVDNNTVQSIFGWAPGAFPALAEAGIFVSGAHNQLTITNNRILNVGGPAIYFLADVSTNVTNATVKGNFMQGSNLAITPPATVTGTTSPNIFVP